MATVDSGLVTRIEDLVRRLEEIPDPQARQVAHSLMEAVLALHGAGLERMMDIVYETGEFGEAAIRRLAGDDLVASLLLLHDLHPDDIETRVVKALGKLHGNAELVGVLEGVVRVRLTGAGCGLQESVKAALRDVAPDAIDILVEENIQSAGFVPLAAIGIPAASGTL